MFIAHAEALLTAPGPVEVLGIEQTRRGRPVWTQDSETGRWTVSERFETRPRRRRDGRLQWRVAGRCRRHRLLRRIHAALPAGAVQGHRAAEVDHLRERDTPPWFVAGVVGHCLTLLDAEVCRAIQLLGVTSSGQLRADGPEAARHHAGRVVGAVRAALMPAPVGPR